MHGMHGTQGITFADIARRIIVEGQIEPRDRHSPKCILRLKVC